MSLHQDGFGREDDAVQGTRAGSHLIDLEGEAGIDRFHDAPDLLLKKKGNLDDLIQKETLHLVERVVERREKYALTD